MSQFVIPNRIFDPAAECMPRADRIKLQATHLRRTIEQAQKIPFYRRKFAEKNISPDSVKTVADLKRLPFTTKQDLRDAYPFGFFAVPRGELARIHASSGTTGKPTFVGYTKKDMKLWADLCARFLVAGGLTSDQLVQVSFGYGLFTGGFGLHGGIERVGAAVLPASSGNTQRQIMLLKDAGINTLICTPSYALNLAETIQGQGLKKGDLALRFAHFGGEPWTEEMRCAIEEELGIHAFNNYGLSEIIGPGVAIECCCQKGMHIFEDHFYPEIINPETGEVLPDGEFGELVLTTLSKYAMPMIRYRTRDLTRIVAEPCECGRTIRRIERISSRSDDMFIIRGVNVFPSQIETALLSVEGTTANYNILLTTEHGLDNIEVDVEVTEELFSDKVRSMEGLQQRLTAAIEGVIGLRVRVKLVAPNTIQRSEGKARRVIDHRER